MKDSKTHVKDLQEFFNDNYIDVFKIVEHGQGNSIKFYEIHFNNSSTVDFDVLKLLDKLGYTPKSLHGTLPNSFYLLVLVNKKTC